MENNNELNKSKIVNASMFLDALKNSGYKGTDSAVAEIVDNSFDAQAQNVFIIGEQNIAGNSERRIVSFAFLDDGTGMDYVTLKSCLTIGYTTNHQKRGIGRFGVGLPQASIFVCDRVEVYSWQNGIDSCKKVYLDKDEIKENDLNEIYEPVDAAIPEKYSKFLKWDSGAKKFDFSQHGTLVVWTKCTHVDYKRWNTCVDHMSKDLGRKYRKFLCSENRTITMIELISQEHKTLLPNDPLYLMPRSLECVPSNLEVFKNNGYESKPYGSDSAYDTCLFKVYKPDPNASEGVDLEVIYEENGEKKKGTVHITYSIVKPEYYSPAYLKTDKKPGSLPFGSNSSILAKNTGISIIRNDREIQFGSFGFYDTYNTPEFRWWGIEIAFGSELDTAFGVSNNKQSVDLKPLSKDEMKEYASDEVKTIWHQLALEIIPTIKEMTTRNSKLRAESEIKDDPTPSTSSTISTIADEGEDLIHDIPEKSEEVKAEEAKEQLEREGNETPSEEQIKKLIDSKVRVVTVFNKGKFDSFVDISYAAATLSIILNANHEFYNKLVKKILEDETDKVPFELFLMAVMKSIKNLDLEYSDAMDRLMHDINERISKYMMEYNKNNG